MTDPDYKALCAELVVIEDAMSGGSVQLSSQGQALDGYAGLAAFRYIAAKARIALAQPEPVVSEVRASVVELQVGVEFLDNEGLVVIANYLRRAIALLQRLSTSTNQEESE
jgi:hypothetical protein